MGKTALITGATSGIGYELTRLLAADHYDLILVARNTEKMEAIRSEFPERSVMIITQDLSIPGAAQRVFSKIKETGLMIDVLINNAGFGLVGAFHALPIDRQVNMVQLNCTALMELTYYVLPDLLKSSSGKILNVASTAAYQPGPFMSVYFASKAFVLSFSEALAEEVGGSHVTVTTLCPGPTHTNFGVTAGADHIKMFQKTMDAAVVAEAGYRAMQSGRRVVIPGSLNRAGAAAARLLPRSWGAKAVRLITKKIKQ